jgi:hypothetical protein
VPSYNKYLLKKRREEEKKEGKKEEKKGCYDKVPGSQKEVNPGIASIE